MRKLVSALTVLLLVLGMTPRTALAAERPVAEIPVSVILTGMEPKSPETYTIELTADKEENPMPAGSSGSVYRMKLKGESTGAIRIPCERLGVFDYTICQIPGGREDCLYDPQVYRLRLFVTQEDSGITVSAVIRDGEGKTAGVVFRNHYANPAYLTLSALKTLDGGTPEDGAFFFRLISEDGKILHEAENDGRRVEFPAMKFDKAGTYRFYLKEVKGEDEKIIYDRTVYTIVVEVTKDTDYHAEVRYERNGKVWTGTPAFANYTDGGSPKTGDTIGVHVTVLTLSAAALILLLLWKRKR